MVSGVISLEFSYSLAPFVASLLLGLFSTAEPHQVRHLFIFLSCDSAYLNINKAEGPFYQQTVAPPQKTNKQTNKKTNNKNNKTKQKQTKQPPPPQKKKKKKTHLSHCMHVGKANYVLFFIELRALLASLTLWDIGCDRNGVRSQERPFWRWVFYFGLWSSFQYKTCFFSWHMDINVKMRPSSPSYFASWNSHSSFWNETPLLSSYKLGYFVTLESTSRWLNTLRPRLNCRQFADDIFKCIFLNGNAWLLFKMSLKFVCMD